MPARLHTRRYVWTRYWTALSTGVEDDFLSETSGVLIRPHDGSRLADLVDDPCLILLGEPGLGKSYAIADGVAELRADGHAVHAVDLGAYDVGEALIGAIVDSTAWRDWREDESVLFLFLDGLDEALLHIRAIHRRLVAELTSLGEDIARLRLRIACRTAEWIPDLDLRLSELFGLEEGPPRLALAPLRLSDAADAALAEGLDSEQFIAEIRRRDVGRLAAFPLTLRMMLDIAGSSNGQLPESQEELFERAILHLAEEPDSGRRSELVGQAMPVGRRLAVAGRIAAAMILSGKAAIESSTTVVSTGDLTIRELEGYSEEDPVAAGGATFRVSVEHIQEVLATALFTDLGTGRLAFAHRRLAEYLAARYLTRHNMDAEQIMSLLTSPDDPDGRLIPQLREVAAWTAMRDRDVLVEVVSREPDVLLRADALALSDELRAQIVAALLTEEIAPRIGFYDRRVQYALSQLRHPSLVDQVRDALEDSKPLLVRQMAFALARAAALPELQADLVRFACTEGELPSLRHDAIWALCEYADGDTRAALVPLVTERIETDDSDEIKGQALQATFPAVLSISDVLVALTPVRNEMLLGSYKLFLKRTLPNALAPAHLPAALEWAASRTWDPGAMDPLTNLADDILAVAWAHMTDEPIRAKVVDLIKQRLPSGSLLGPFHDRDDTRTLRDQPGRGLLVNDLLSASAEGEVQPEWLVWSDPPILIAEDYASVVAELRKKIGKPEEAVWATAAGWLFAPERCDVAEMMELREESEMFREQTEGWVAPVDLDSDIAQRHRRRAEQRDPTPDVVTHEAVDSAVHSHLDAVESGEADGWWQLNHVLLYDGAGEDGFREFQCDLTACAGWERADEVTRERIIAAARRYLEGAPPDADLWFGRGRVNRPAFAGYRALHLLARLRPVALEALDEAAWARWMPIIVAYPRSNSDDERFDEILHSLAAIYAPAPLTTWALRMIDVQNESGQGELFLLWRLQGVISTLSNAFADKLEDTNLRPKARGDLVRYGMTSDPSTFLPKVSARLSATAIEHDRATALEVASAALASAPGAAWPSVLDMFQRDPLLGREVFERVAFTDVDLGSNLDDSALHQLLDWLLGAFPAAEDPPLDTGFVPPRAQAAQARDRLLVILTQRGSDQAIAAIDNLASKYPGPGITRLRSQAREARLQRWTAPTPRQVIQLAQSNDARIVLSARQLHQAVCASLRRIQNRLVESTPPSVRELWNTGEQFTPKHEEELSTWLRARLDEDLRVGGHVIGRELEIRANATGRGRGESADIVVFAPIGTDVEGAETASIIIEAKGCWHRDVRTSMRAQLVDRYLTGTETTHGIYVVFWFAAENWDPNDGRRGRCAGDIAELVQTLADQAHSITEGTHATVQSVVIDASLPPRIGPARRAE